MCYITENIISNVLFRYCKAAQLGDEILVNAKTIKAGKTLAFLEVVIQNKATGEVLVKGTHTKYLMRAK